MGAGLFSILFTAVSCYAMMPLRRVADTMCESSEKELMDRLAHRHKGARWSACLLLFWHFVVTAALIIHLNTWRDVTNRIFGICEVLLILGFPCFMLQFLSDDMIIAAHGKQKAL